MTEIPKVTRECLFPSSGGADQAVGNNAEPEVHEQAHVEMEGPVTRERKRGRKKEVDHVTEDDGEQSLEQISQHRGFRQRLPRLRAPRHPVDP
jgi:hypothetical protein